MILCPLPSTNNSLASLPSDLTILTFLTGSKSAHSNDAKFPASSLSKKSIIFSNLLNIICVFS